MCNLSFLSMQRIMKMKFMFIHVLAYVLPGRKGLSQFLSKQDEPSSCKTCCQFDGKAKEFVCAFQQTYSLVGWLVCLF